MKAMGKYKEAPGMVGEHGCHNGKNGFGHDPDFRAYKACWCTGTGTPVTNQVQWYTKETTEPPLTQPTTIDAPYTGDPGPDGHWVRDDPEHDGHWVRDVEPYIDPATGQPVASKAKRSKRVASHAASR